MAIHSLRLLVLTAVLTSSAAAGGFDPPVSFFEEIDGPQAAWRTIGSPAEATILPQGFILRSGDRLHRFRWDESMRLETLHAEEVLESSSYLLTTADGATRELRHARRLRASNADATLSVVYYFGPRGFEFDIELVPGAQLPEMGLESLDGEFSVSADGQANVDGKPLALKPVAYNEDTLGGKRLLSANYRLATPAKLQIWVETPDNSQKLVIDPVVTLVSYFGGSEEVDVSAIRELPDGSVLLVGIIRTLGHPQGVTLTGTHLKPPAIEGFSYCYVAVLADRGESLRSLSYLGAGEFTRCDHVDLDSSGRIIVAGQTQNRTGIASRDGQFQYAKYFPANYLARLSSDGTKLEYATYLRLDGFLTAMRAGPGQTVYLSVLCHASGWRDCADAQVPGGFHPGPGVALLMRYDIAARRFDAKTFLPGALSIDGLEISPTGVVYAHGNARNALPLVNPIQHSVPDPTYYGGYVAAFSADLSKLLFSTLFAGGRGGGVSAVKALADGTIWLVGNAREGELPNVQPTAPFERDEYAPYSVLLKPGETSLRKAFWLGGAGAIGTIDAIVLSNGRMCSVLSGGPEAALPGGAAIARRLSSVMLGCLNDAATQFALLTSLQAGGGYSSNVHVSPARDGGVWSAGPFGDEEISNYDWTDAERGNIVLRHLDLRTPNPSLDRPSSVLLLSLRGNRVEELVLRGSNFSVGMQLQFDGNRIPLEVVTPYQAELVYRSASTPGNILALDLRLGRFEGRLVVPTVSEEIFSEPFLVEVGHLPPSGQPFFLTSDPQILYVREPVYPDSVVRWNGSSVQLIPNPEGKGAYAIIPPSLMQPGEAEAVIVNPGPGGGVQRQPFLVSGNAILNRAPEPVPSVTLVGGDFAVDRSAGVVYTAHAGAPGEWIVQSNRLTDGGEVAQVSIARSIGEVAIDVEVSSDGKYLYLLDDQLVVTRLRTDPLRKDLEIPIPPDARAFSRTSDYGWRLKALRGQPEAFAVTTQGGRLVIYDGDRRRPYTSGEFPTALIDNMQPLLATRDYIYVRQKPLSSSDQATPCIARYRIDSLGLTPPEGFCNPDREWGKYPEMIRFGNAYALQDGDEIVSVSDPTTDEGLDRAVRPLGSVALDNNAGVAARVQLYPDGGPRGEDEYRLQLTDFSGAEVGRFPGFGALPTFPIHIRVVGDDALILTQVQGFGAWSVRLFPQWRSHAQWYDEPAAPIRSGTVRPTYRGQRSMREPSLRGTR